jgi:hypothetical protein
MLSTLSPEMSTLDTLETILTTTIRSAGRGGGKTMLVGGQGLVGDSIDFISYDPTDNSLVVNNGKQTPSAFWAKPTGSGGEKHEDQFFYRQSDVRLKRGEKAQFTLSQADLTYTDEYSLGIEGTAGPSGLTSPMETQVAFHHIVFKNETGQPLTAATASFFSDGQLIGQSDIEYTPIGGNLEYSVGSAPEIRTKVAEEELNRKRGARQKDKLVYDQLTTKGTISIENTSTKKVKIRVAKSVTGEVTGASDKPIKFKPVSDALNDTTYLNWTIEIDPGKTFKITYEYRAYVPGT